MQKFVLRHRVTGAVLGQGSCAENITARLIDKAINRQEVLVEASEQGKPNVDPVGADAESEREGDPENQPDGRVGGKRAGRPAIPGRIRGGRKG